MHLLIARKNAAIIETGKYKTQNLFHQSDFFSLSFFADDSRIIHLRLVMFYIYTFFISWPKVKLVQLMSEFWYGPCIFFWKHFSLHRDRARSTTDERFTFSCVWLPIQTLLRPSIYQRHDIVWDGPTGHYYVRESSLSNRSKKREKQSNSIQSRLMEASTESIIFHRDWRFTFQLSEP